jgi:hypothetical protein
MKEKDTKKLTVNPWRIIKIFILAYLIFELIFYVSFQGVNGSFWPLDNSFYYYTPILFVATGIFCYISLTQTYYEIDGATFIHSKMGKVVEYTFNNIIYIDEEFSESKKMMRFFTKEGKEHVLIFDKNAVLYHTALKKCPLISKEEFQRRFPNIKM